MEKFPAANDNHYEDSPAAEVERKLADLTIDINRYLQKKGDDIEFGTIKDIEQSSFQLDIQTNNPEELPIREILIHLKKMVALPSNRTLTNSKKILQIEILEESETKTFCQFSFVEPRY